MITLPDSDITATDIFCGAGGSSQGARRVNGVRIKLAVNHWKKAVETHSANFPDTDHDCVDLQITDPRRYKRTRMLLISPDCRRHSNGSGTKRNDRRQLSFWDGGPEDPSAIRSRATMNEVYKFADHHKYDIIIVENVVEVTKWDEFDKWWKELTERLDYTGQTCCFNSMFFWPTPQSRDRIYFVFSRKGIKPPKLDYFPPAWCARCQKNVGAVQSWKKQAVARKIGKYKQQYIYCCPECAMAVEPYYYCAANAVDWSLPVERIGDRKRPLKPKTMARIETGLNKFARTGFVVETAYSHAPDNRVKGVNEPMPTASARQSQGLTVPPYLLNTTQRNKEGGYLRPLTDAGYVQTTAQTMGVVVPPFMTEHVHEYRTREATEPLSTIVAQGNHNGVVVPPFMVFPNQTGDNRSREVEQPLPTQTGSLAPALVTPPMIVEMYNTSTARPVTEGLSTVVAGGNHHDLLVPPWLMANYSPGTHHPMTDPVGTITSQDHHSLVMGLGGATGSRRDIDASSDPLLTQTGTRQFGLAVAPWLTSYYNTDQGHPITEGVPTVTSHDRHALVAPPPFIYEFYGRDGNSAPITNPLGTTTSVAKHYLAQLESLPIKVEDCGFRMLQPHEIGRAMAFEDGYQVFGTSKEKVKQYGQAVTPPVMEWLVSQCVEVLA